MEERILKAMESKIGDSCPVNIPVQMMAVTDRDGKITPMWFRYEDEEHHVEKVSVEKTISRDESMKVGVREKRFICSVIMGDEQRLMELRYHIENHRWRIFQFLS